MSSASHIWSMLILWCLMTVNAATDLVHAMLATVTLSSFAVHASTVDIHIGIAAQFSGDWSNYGNIALDVEEFYFNKLEELTGNTINGVKYNFIRHHLDTETSITRYQDFMVPFVQGTYDTRSQSNWAYSSYTSHKTGLAGVEPAPHALDVVFIHYGSGFIPHGLQALKDANIRMPVYACGSNARSVWILPDGSNRWDYALNCGECIAEDEARPMITMVAQKKPKTAIFLEKTNAGAWTESICTGMRDEATTKGVKIIKDLKLDFKNCGNELFPEGEAKAAFDKCRAENEAMLEEGLGDVLYRGKQYTADILTLCTYADVCVWLPQYLQKHNINFQALVGGELCTPRLRKQEVTNGKKAQFEEWISKGDGRYLFDYWLGANYVAGLVDVMMDHGYSTTGIFGEYGDKASAGMWTELQTFRGQDPNEQGGYIESMLLNGWQYFMNDVFDSQGDKSKIINNFNSKRPIFTSLWGLGGATPGGWNDYHANTVVQKFPDYIESGLIYAVGPESRATQVMLYPVPMWTSRHCEDKCVACAMCDYLEEILQIVTIAILIAFGVLSVFGALIAKTVGGPKAPKVIFNSGLMFGAFLLNIVTDIFAIFTMYAQMEEEILDKTNIVTYVYAAFIIVDILPAWARLKVHGIGIGLGWTCVDDDASILYFSACDQIACLLGTPFDCAIFLIQCNVAMLSPSYAIITSMLMTAMSLGYAAGCPGTLSFILSLLNETNLNVGDHCSIRRLTIVTANPLDLKLMKPKEELEKYRVGQVKAQDDKSK